MSVYAVSDLHGRYDLYEKICNYLAPEDKVICLGDCGDRGPDSWKTIRAVLANPQWVFLKGNHEDMLIDAMEDFIQYDVIETAYFNLAYNGGKETFDAAIADAEREQILSQLKNLPFEFVYNNSNGDKIILSHAGYTPGHLISDNSKLWNRHHFREPWDWKNYSDTVIIHGHTPTPYLMEAISPIRYTDENFPWGAVWYCGGRKVDIDCCSYASGIACVLDLDTFEDVLILDDTYEEVE